jgi:diphthamide synthase subunit DPH2
MNTNIDLVVNDLTEQIKNLSKEKAIYVSLATQYKQELEAVKRELEELKNVNKSPAAQ